MSRGDAYEEEMAFMRRLTQSDEERLIAGNASDRGDLAELAAFTSALRASASEAVPPASAAFIARLSETARASAETTEERRSTIALRPLSSPVRPRPRLALVARVAVAAATVPLLFAGLAFAGVSLPGPADDAFESIGIELPNQAADPDDDTEGTAKDGDSAGSATGQENSAGKLGHGKTKPKNGKALGHDKAKDNEGKALGKNGLAPGLDISESKRPDDPGGGSGSAGGNAGGNSGASSGGGGGSGKSSGGSGAASVGSGGGPPAGKGPSK